MITNSRRTIKAGQYEKTTLRNGLRVVSEKLPWARSVAIGIWADVGSRNEKPEENGLSHFIEHMVFKGTANRTSSEVAASLESVGGNMNAFTSRENTCYTGRCPAEHLTEAIDVLADIVCRATFAPANIRKEKTVICEEIKESQDTPSDRIHDNFSKAFWGKHPLGQPILGDQKNVMSLTRRQVLDYVNRHYRSESVVVAVCGAVSHRRLVQLVRDKVQLPGGRAEEASEPIRTRDRKIAIQRSAGFQTHLCLGFPGLDYGHKDKMAAIVLQSYLGGGMSSVLFQKVREERGLAYSVYAFNDFYRDTGIFGAYLGTDGKSVRQAYEIVCREFRRVKRSRIASLRLEQVKTQIAGNLALGLESTSSRMARLGRQEIVLGRVITLPAMIRAIRRVTADDVLATANQIIDESKLAVAALGPIKKNVLGDVC